MNKYICINYDKSLHIYNIEWYTILFIELIMLQRINIFILILININTGAVLCSNAC